MDLDPTIRAEIERLGGVAPSDGWETAVWPQGRFNASGDRIRTLFPEYRDLGDEAVFDPFHPVRELSFVGDVRSGFWDSWEQDFSGVDPSIHIPFSSDEAYLFFIHSPDGSAQPMVSKVDHETTNESPYCPPNLSLATFLRILEPMVERARRLP